jgi:coenzyme F420-dependent glucose-6-phosphate dehydrogenase
VSTQPTGGYDANHRNRRETDEDTARMPRMIQLHVSLADTLGQAVKERPNGGMPFPKADIREPEGFQAMAKQVSIENVEDRVLTSEDLDEVFALNGGRNQVGFIRVYRERVMSIFDWPEKD